MTVTIKDKAPLIVPPGIRRRAGIKPGDRLEFKASRGVITIVAKPEVADDEYTPEQRRMIDREIAKGLQDVKMGRVYAFDTVAEMRASIEGHLKKRASARKTKPRR